MEGGFGSWLLVAGWLGARSSRSTRKEKNENNQSIILSIGGLERLA
jgi:hypothetical protein